MSVVDEALPVRGDMTRLVQVMVNLLNNAAKYTPEGGAIRIAAHSERHTKQILEVNREALQRIANALLEREVLDASEIKLLVDGKELPTKPPSPGKSDDGVQQVLKPEPGRPGIVKGGESPARA